MSTYFTILLWKQLQKSYIMSNKVFDEGNAASEVLRELGMKSFTFSANHVDTMISR